MLDIVGGSYLQRNLAVLRPEGRLAQIAVQEASKSRIDLFALMLKRLSIVGSTLRPQSVDSKARIAAALEAQVWPLVESGLVRPVIDARPSAGRGGGGARPHGGGPAHRQDPAAAQRPVTVRALRLCAPHI